MKDIIEYKLLTGKDNSEFCNRVTKFLNDGWELYGSPFINIDHLAIRKTTIVGQAVVKRK
jgi:hypothetical protein